MNDFIDYFNGVYLSNDDQDDLLTREEILDLMFPEDGSLDCEVNNG